MIFHCSKTCCFFKSIRLLPFFSAQTSGCRYNEAVLEKSKTVPGLSFKTNTFGVIRIKDHKKEKGTIVLGFIFTFSAIASGMMFKNLLGDIVANYLLIVPTVLFLPVLLVAMDHNKEITSHSKLFYYMISTVTIGIVLFMTSFKDMNIHCENGSSVTCTLSTPIIFLVYLVIIGMGIGVSNFHKDKHALETEKLLVKYTEENTRLKKENELLKRKQDEKRKLWERIKNNRQ